MIRFTALYPNTDGGSFDFDGYLSKHIPYTRSLLGDALVDVQVEKGIAGAAGAAPPFKAVGHLHFESIEAFRAAFLPHLEKLRADVATFTNIQPLIQIGEILPGPTRLVPIP